MNVHGGIVHTLTVTGDADIHGGIVKQLIVHGNCTQYGGIVNQRVIMAAAGPTDRAKAEPNSAQKQDAPYTAQTQGKPTNEPRMARGEPPEPTIIYKDKIVYKEREKVVYRDRLPEECENELKDLRKLTRYYEGYAHQLEQEIDKQNKRISRLNEQLEKALNRERVAVMSRKDAQKELERIMANQWDAYRPTKEEVRRYYKVLLALLDCETSY
jgi:hypothetical protein